MEVHARRLRGEAGKEKEAKSEAKELWKLLKLFKVTPAGDGRLTAQERALAQQIATGERQLNAKVAGDVSAKWEALQRCACSICNSLRHSGGLYSATSRLESCHGQCRPVNAAFELGRQDCVCAW